MIAAIPLITSALSMLGSSDTATSAAKTVASSNGGDFSQVMAKLTKEATDNVKSAESLSVDGLSGKSDIQSVVQAVMTAQESLQTALAIRDKAVAAFQEVSRMAI